MTNTLTFTDWEHYTDDDSTAFTLDWSDPSVMVGKFAYPYLDALRQAYNERTILYRNPFPQLPAGSPWTRMWVWAMIEAIHSLTMALDYEATIGCWIAPGHMPTIHNVQRFQAGDWSTELLEAAYTGPHSLFPESDFTQWRACLSHLMDDASISDTTFRDWMAGDFWPMWPNVRMGYISMTYVPMSAIVWNLRKMLNQLDTLVLATTVFPADSELVSIVPSGLSVTGGISEGRAVHYSDATSWATAVAAFNATSWNTTWLLEGPFSTTIGHKGIGDYHDTTINRVRRTDAFTFPVMTNARVEIAQNLHWTGYQTFTPSDFAGLSGYAYDQEWLWAVQTSVDTAGSVEDVAFGNYGDVSLAAAGDQLAWLGGDYALRVDYSGSYFGGSGFVFHA